MRLSIITVCYNSEKTIESTIKSILSQTNKNFEWIVVDGKSTDKTIEIIKRYLPEFKDNNIEVKLISEKDNGAYDAMNKGALSAEGDYLTYMNSDDTYYDDKSLDKFMNALLFSNADIIYGNTYFRKCGGAS